MTQIRRKAQYGHRRRSAVEKSLGDLRSKRRRAVWYCRPARNGAASARVAARRHHRRLHRRMRADRAEAKSWPGSARMTFPELVAKPTLPYAVAGPLKISQRKQT